MATSDGAGIGANRQGEAQPGQDSKYWAFISYSHADEVWAKWLHRTLETYRIPKRLLRRDDKQAPLPRRLLPIFRDADELPGSPNLGAKLEEALRSSRALIVICSPHAARSRWVDQEIRTFQAAGGEDRIFAVIVDGEPNASDPARECFPPGLQKGSAEPLACDPREGRDGKANCKLRLVAGMLGLSFDELKRRDRQRRIRRAVLVASASVVLAAVLAAMSYYGLNQRGIAESRRNAVKSQEIASQDPVTGLELAIAAGRTAPTIEASRALSNALRFQLTRTILRHPASIAGASFSPDAKRVLTCTNDGTARVWDTHSARLDFTLKSAGDGDRSHACIFSPDGSRILTITARGGARLWNAQSGQMTATLAGHTGEVLTGRFSPDGTRVVTGGQDKTARVWDAKTGRQQIAFAEHDTSVAAAFFFPDNARVVSIGSQGKAIVWNASTGEATARFGEPVPFVQDAVLSPDGKRLLISNYQYSAVLWDPNTGEQIGQLTTRSSGAAFTRDSARLITGSGDGRVTVWEAEDGSAVKELFHGGPVGSVMFSPDASLVITADERPHIWDMPELGGGGAEEVFSLRGHNTEAVLADVSKDGELLLTFGPSDRTVRVWDIAGGPYMKVFGGPDPEIGDVLFSPDGSKILTSGDLMQIWAAKSAQHLSTMKKRAYISSGQQFSKDGTRLMYHCGKGSVCVFDTTSGALRWEVDDVHTVESAFSSGGNLVAVAGEDHSLIVFDVASGKRRVFVGVGESPISIVFSPDDRQVLASFRGEQYVWDLASGRQVRKLKGYGALFSPDRASIATVQRDVARRYDAATGRLLNEWKIPAKAIETHAFSHDSLLLAAGSTDGLIKVWENKTGREVLSLKPEDGRVRVLRFSADGKDLTAVTDGAIHVYSMANGNEWQTFHNNFGLTSVAVSPDGSSVVAVDTRRRALLYSLKFADLLATAERRRPAVGSAP